MGFCLVVFLFFSIVDALLLDVIRVRFRDFGLNALLFLFFCVCRNFMLVFFVQNPVLYFAVSL